MADVETTASRVLNGLMWSMAQSWGSRLLTFLLFLVLARLLTPADLGLASTVALVLLVLGFIAEFGYGEALIQRRELAARDVTLPFATSLAVALALAAGMAVFSEEIAARAELPSLAPLLTLAALSLPIATTSAFQEALYKRAFDYRSLALRMLTATLVSGVVGIAAALAGLGAMSLVLQALTLNLVGAVWLWSRPRWVPTRERDARSWRQLSAYSVNVVANRLLDFVTTRTIDVLILTLHGVVALGLYTVGARVYQTLMQVLTATVTDVSLSALSRMAHDRPRMAATYVSGIGVSAFVASPVFVALAALSPELSVVLFGERWAASAAVMQPLMLIGAVQTVQFVNGAYFGAMGKPSWVVGLGVVKLAVVVPAMLMVPTGDVGGLTTVFAAASTVVTPLTFGLAVVLLGLSWRDIVDAVAGVALSAGLAFAAVAFARPEVAAHVEGDLPRAILLGVLFGLVHLAGIALFARARMRAVVALVGGKLLERRGRAAALAASKTES